MNKRIFLLGGSTLLLIIVAIVLSMGDVIKKNQHITTDTAPATTESTPILLPDGKSNLSFEIFQLPDGSMLEGSVIKSPLALSGRARGTWYFEASFPIELKDSEGNTLVTAVAQAQSDWMTEDFVDWSATMTWDAASTTATSGVLIFKKDNPSGLPEHDASLEIPILFQ